MLLYLGHSRPDISFATHQCARYTPSPKQSHENALIRIGRYLKGTLNQGLILNPSETLKIECYPDADFAGLWNRDEKQVPYCVRSRTGYVVCLSNCPVLWKSKLQTEITLSTMGGRIRCPQHLVPRPILINRHYQRIMYSITSQDASKDST